MKSDVDDDDDDDGWFVIMKKRKLVISLYSLQEVQKHQQRVM